METIDQISLYYKIICCLVQSFGGEDIFTATIDDLPPFLFITLNSVRRPKWDIFPTAMYFNA